MSDTFKPAVTEERADQVWSALSLLIRAGLPLVATGPSDPADQHAKGKPTAGEMAAATLAILPSTTLAPWMLEAVGAFLLAWAHEWPGSFQASFGARGRDVGTWAREHTPDAGRYLKLRRMAIANLASVL